jgi:hypothetical protein
LIAFTENKKMEFFMRVVVAVFLALALSACGSADKPFLGFWKVQGDRFEYLKIEKNGEGHLLTRYGNSILDGSVERKEFPATIKDNTLTIGALGVSGVYKESDKTLVLNGKQVFAKVDDAEALKVIEAKEQEKAQAEADCKALQEEVDRKNQELKGKSKEEWNAYVKSLDGRKPKRCWLKNAGMAW